jgi:hypothetical protein
LQYGMGSMCSTPREMLKNSLGERGKPAWILPGSITSGSPRKLVLYGLGAVGLHLG